MWKFTIGITKVDFQKRMLLPIKFREGLRDVRYYYDIRDRGFYLVRGNVNEVEGVDISTCDSSRIDTKGRICLSKMFYLVFGLEEVPMYVQFIIGDSVDVLRVEPFDPKSRSL